MSLLYQWLGRAAQIGAQLSRVRLNFIPLSAFPLFGVMFAFLLTTYVLISPHDGNTPHTFTLKQVMAKPWDKWNYISVHGHYLHDSVYDRKPNSERASFTPGTYVAFTDTQKTGAILVATTDVAALPAGDVTLTGMLEDVDALGIQTPQQEAGLPYVRLYYVQPGAKPTSPIPSLLLALILDVPAVIYLTAFVQLYVIFRRGDTLIADSMAAAGNPTQANAPTFFTTGQFHLQQHGAERFLQAPATLNVLPSGEIAIYVNADASRYSIFYFIPRTQQRVGYWASLIAPGSVHKLEAGLQYVGASSRWALRFTYLDPISRRHETMVLAFADEEFRRQVRTELEKMR
jgi:hypothetical protein